jgi:hypothetical protein
MQQDSDQGKLAGAVSPILVCECKLTLRYPGCQRRGSGAVQAFVRGRTSRSKTAGPRAV